MAKARSPAYPAIGLREAIEAVGRIYKEDYQNPIPRDVAARHMGYNGLNGKSLGALSALLKYGLLEGRGNETRVSDRAVQILAYQPGSTPRCEAIVEAMKGPELFIELDLRFQNGKASDQAIRSYLLTQKFIPSAADNALRSYRETKMLVSEEFEEFNKAAALLGGQVPDVAAFETAKEHSVEGTPHPAAIQNVAQHAFEGVDLSKVNNFSIVDQGAVIHVRGTVDRKGLDRLLKKLAAYKAVLDAAAEDEDEAAN